MAPKAVVLLASDDPKRNLSDEAWQAWNEPAITATVPWFSGHVTTKLAGGTQRVIVEELRDGGPPLDIEEDAADKPRVKRKPHPHVRRRPATATVKEQLDADEFGRML